MVPHATFAALAQEYQRETTYGLALISEGQLLANRCGYYPWSQVQRKKIDPELMIREALRWGEAFISLDAQGTYLWCVPICLNSRVVGGLFSASFPNGETGEREQRVGRAAKILLDLACRENICNASLMQVNRELSADSARQAEIIHSLKNALYQNPREVYLREELELLTAIKKGNKEKARGIINKILVGVYNLGKGNLDILKTLVLEMVVLMYRAAVDKGADPRELLGVNSSYLKTFPEIQNEVDLSHWLTRWLEAFISTSLGQARTSPPDSISIALEYMKNNLEHPITRDEVARSCSMSPGYFSRVFHEKTEHTFTDLLNKFRIEQACFLLDDTRMSLYEIALETGFNDQSYFNKVFKKYRGLTPKEYRRKRTPAC